MPEKIVKSVGRVFSILELFDRERRALKVADIARLLDYPHTSTLAILKSMQELGYFSYDPTARTFLPSMRVPQLVEWITANVQAESAILGVMSEMHDEIDETINLSRQTGDFVKIIHGIESTKLLGIRVRRGVVMSLTASHTGLVALATYPDKEIKQILRDSQKRNYPNARGFTIEQILKDVHQIREQQISRGYDVLVDGIGIISFPLCSQTGDLPFVVSVAGPTDRIRANESRIIKIAIRAINNNKARLAYPA